MIKCSKCGYMNDDDSLFCEECGEKLEKEEKCPSCGALLKPGKKFCAKCGCKINVSGLYIGDKNVIGGDVIGKKEETKIFGNATIIKNEDQTKQVRKCHICGSLIPITHGFECPDCGEFTCKNCFDSEQGICRTCAEQKKQGRETQYKKAFQKAMTDGKIEFAERKELFALQKSLGLDSETARRLEEEQKREGEEDSSLTIFDSKTLVQAKSAFYDKGDPAVAMCILEPLYQKYPDSEEVLNLYLPILACIDRNKAQEIIDGLDADILMAYITNADIAIKSSKYDYAEQILKKAKRIWPDSVLVDCYRAIFYYALDRKFEDPSFLRQANEIAGCFGEAANELELSYSIMVNDLLSEKENTCNSLYDQAYCKENNLYWNVVNSNPFMTDSLVCTVGNDSDCNFNSIQEAIDSIREGGIITVRPGVYKEDLVFTKAVTLKGSSEDIKDKASKDLPIVLLGKKTCIIDKRVKINGLLFTHNSNLGFKKLTDVISLNLTEDDNDEVLAGENPLFVDISADAEIKNCAFIGAANNAVGITDGQPKLDKSYVIHCHGLNISGSSQPVINNCVLNGNNEDGLTVLGNANPSVESCEVFNNKNGSGLCVLGDATGIYRNCKIHDNKTEGENYVGVCIAGQSNPTLEDCEIYNQVDSGIWIKGNAKGTYKTCVIHDNKFGVKICGQSNPTLEGCEIYNHESIGIWITDNAMGTYKTCSIHDNEIDNDIDGIRVQDKALPTVESCEVFNIGNHALCVLDDATGTYRDCKIHDSWLGVCIAGQSNPTLEGCEIYNHESICILITDNAKGTYKTCVIHDNKFGVKICGQSNPTLEGCEIYNHESIGIWITDNAMGTYKTCCIHDNENIGIKVQDKACLSVYSCEIFKNNGGFCFKWEATGIYWNCKIHDNEFGVYVSDQTNPRFEKCEIYNNKDSGLIVCDSARGTYKNCIIHDNENNPIKVQDTASPSVESCEIFKNENTGIKIFDEATGIYRNCKIHDNNYKTESQDYFRLSIVGVEIYDQSNPTLEGCEIYNHEGIGIWITDNAMGTYKTCCIHDNENTGIEVQDKASPTVESCEVFNNRNGAGLCVLEDATGTYRNCKIHDNKTEEEGYVGVCIAGQSKPTLEGCEIYNHLSYGIWIKENARGLYRNCTGYNNKFDGIKTEPSAKPTIRNCNIRIS